MRLQRIELTRYGGYEGRTIDLGDGRPDLHLIIGPNESGKSTLLSAIGDLLFGFPERTPQDWRFDAKDLRVAACVTHNGAMLRVTRRRGRKNTLLDSDGAPLPDEVLAAMLGGIDRSGFDRLFGLDHAKLRAGGRAILDGKDDAAQSLFEAGTGMSATGAQLRRLESECRDLFAPSASKPRINQLLRERADALERQHKATLGVTDWTKLQERRSNVEAGRAELDKEEATLFARMNEIERLGRARAPLRRLAAARDEIAGIGPLPRMPNGAIEALKKARAERATTLELRDGHQENVTRATKAIANITLPEAILAAAVRIDALEERRPQIDRMRRDLPGKAAALKQIDATIAGAGTASGLALSAGLPGTAWRRRVRKHLEDHRALETRARNNAENLRENELERLKAEEARALVPETADMHDLKTAMADLSPDKIQLAQKSRAACERATKRAATALSALGWGGSTDSLASALLPSLAEVEDYADRARGAREALKKGKEAADVAAAEVARLRAKLDELVAGGTLPTTAALNASRDVRGKALEEVRVRLGQDRRSDDGDAAGRLAVAIGVADLLADRRDAASQQIAEHNVASAALTKSEAEALAAKGAVADARQAIDLVEAAWSHVRGRAGIADSLPPWGFAAWKEARDRCVELCEDAESARVERQAQQAALESAADRLSVELDLGGTPSGGDLGARLKAAQTLIERAEAAARARVGLDAQISGLERDAQSFARETRAIERLNSELEDERVKLLAEGGISAVAAALLADIPDILDGVTEEVGARPGLARDVDGMNRDIAGFEHDALSLLSDLARPPGLSMSESVRQLAADLEVARRSSEELSRLRELLADEGEAMESVDRRLATAQTVIDRLLASAAVATEEELDVVVDLLEKRSAANGVEREAAEELAVVGGGTAVEDLAIAARELSENEGAAERDRIDARRREIASEREEIGGEATEVRLAIERAGTAAEAADAQQAVAEARAALAVSADRYIETAASAALLRWAIERYRAGSQAPLLVRAGALLETITQSAFGAVALDYGDDDSPRIVAVRTDGHRVGIEGLTEGTRDQLFLALRLASLQGRADQGALPLICDDLLITSDDDRSSAMLRVLRKTSDSMQVMVFTHHDHIEDLAARALGPDGFHIHRLTPAL